jgi:hypothetical protein
MSAAVRRKPDWCRKVTDVAIVAKWVKEFTEQKASAERIDYVLAELRWLASLAVGPVQPAEVDGCWQGDHLIPADVKAALQAQVAPLEAGPKDWHPGSKNMVLDLVHPSLYPMVFDRSPALPLGTRHDWRRVLGGGTPAPPPHPSHDSFSSRQFQWLPTLFDVAADGSVLIASYINNLHPDEHEALYHTIARVFERFVPLFERVLGDLKSPRPPRVVADADWYEPEASGEEEDEDYDEDPFERRQLKPLAVPVFAPPPNAAAPYSLRGRSLKVIVKLANIVLTPENPVYNGGTWHVEGMRNEAIVASGIYYYHSENISESLLRFRAAIEDPPYEQGDDRGVAAVYGLRNEDPLNQDRGAIVTQEDRCIAFPNIMQHRVAPFHLVDPTRPGLRKILVFFLVDPAARVHTTGNVPPQQREWFERELQRVEHLQMFPKEIVGMMAAFLPLMRREEALEHRTVLMKERSQVTDAVTEQVFDRPFSLCEH